MGKTQAASVPWADLTAAIQANPQRGVTLGGPAALVVPDESTVSWMPSGWTEDNSFTVTDAVSFALWVRDPLYRVATPTVRRAMEMEEAAALLHESEAAWAANKTRGWVRKHLEEDLRARASGGDPSPDVWDAVRTVKRAAQLVDYICVSRGLRFALWWPDQKAVTVIPMSGPTAPVVGLNCLSARVLIGPGGHTVAAPTWAALCLSAKEMTWFPPACAPSIGTQTVATIQEALDAIAPGQPRTGGRTALWTRLMWARLVKDLEGLPESPA